MIGLAEQPQQCLLIGGVIHVAAWDDIILPQGQTIEAQRLLVPRPAVCGHHILLVIAQQGNAPVSPADEILCGGLPGPEIVGIHVMEAPAAGMADDHRGHVLRGLNPLLGGQQHQPADIAAVHQLTNGFRRGLAALPRAQQHIVAAFRRGLSQPLQHLRVKRVPQTFGQIGRENDPDHPRPAVDQTAGHLVGMKAHLLGQRADPFPGLFADTRIIMQSPADCGGRHPRSLGYVFNGTFHRAPHPFRISAAPLRANVCMMKIILLRNLHPVKPGE